MRTSNDNEASKFLFGNPASTRGFTIGAPKTDDKKDDIPASGGVRSGLRRLTTNQ